MSHKLSHLLIGSLIVIFSLSSTGMVRADWVIDGSGTLIEVDAIALGDSQATIAMISDSQPSPATLSRQKEAEQVREQSYAHYQGLLTEYQEVQTPLAKRRGESELSFQSRQQEAEEVGSKLQTQLDQAKQEYEARQQQVEAQITQAQQEIRENREVLEAKRQEVRSDYQQDVEARKTRLESQEETIHSRIENKEGALQITQETKNQQGEIIRTTSTPLPAEERLRIERPDNTGFQIEPGERGELKLQTEQVQTRTDQSLSVGPNNQLILHASDGNSQEVRVLPDAAIANMKQQGYEVQPQAKLTFQDQRAVYQFETQEYKKFLGFFTTPFIKNANLDAQTGEVIKQEQPNLSAWQRFIESLSF